MRIVEKERKSAASLYGQFPSGAEVAALVKIKDSSVNVDVKATERSYAQAVCNDLQTLSL